ncbi:hypothetical protein FHL15_002145 [Xylaria flabelliformis]|uniref:Uncharacterized protein n=1 Tax=Xylaria flabelliformis TaxID=2512241 RepID=A0A553I9G5_9PEZI|nr:hypothetical protein FHL15_002145 [Xylaria flabelliformis]
MPILKFITASYLLAISAAAPAETQHHNIKPAPEYSYPHYPIITTTPTQSSYSSQTLPGSCYTTWDDCKHTTATVKTHECYTRTSLIPPGKQPPIFPHSPYSTPPIIPSSPPNSIKAKEEEKGLTPTQHPAQLSPAPRGPRTSGASTTLPCPTCEACPIPTEWITYTTGCVGTPTITEVNTVTPA